ncbi:MAG: hypothetical protein AB2799_19160 [Candidatus Thiodiazotropha sp.]
MNIEKRRTETYILTNLGTLDPVTVYVTNYQQGKGKIVIECFGDVWANYWGGKRLQWLQMQCQKSSAVTGIWIYPPATQVNTNILAV